MTQRKTPYNSTYKKLAVQWLIEALCFVSSFVVAESFVLPCLLEGGSQAGKSPTSCSCKPLAASVADDTKNIKHNKIRTDKYEFKKN